ncbi:hypothetical protein O6H91_16G059700 [Diphasiastrum complanatum]|uniref:Uncharacterized protein n=1 Tax=Diphasiastrum complanatum TaxID=34168 RepID=A0ACC2BCP4_DIPCM|nr:hypothetical protein O6H91_16G059700 [Diphasiastrum complanatum]
MATTSWLDQYQANRNASNRLIVAIEDVSDLWPVVKEAFEARLPLKKASLNNKARNLVTVEKLPIEYILTTDPRLRGRIIQEQSPFLFRHPFATVLLITCEDLDDYKAIVKPRLRSIIQNDDREWFIVFVSRANAGDPTGKSTKKVYNKLEVDFSSKKRERCCRLEISAFDTAVWEDIEARMVDCIRNTLDRRVQLYEEEVRKLSENRYMPSWNFCNFFIVKESLAYMFETAHLVDDALSEYDELEQVYLETVKNQSVKKKDFGGMDPGDARAALLEPSRKSFKQFAQDDSFKEFDFCQYLFARQAMLLFNLNRPVDVISRGFFFILSFSKRLLQYEKDLPFCLREVWVITACIGLAKATAERFTSRLVGPDVEKEYYRVQADLNFHARIKLMRLADLIGYGCYIQRSPCNSASLSMLPWPRPAVWPPIPPDAAAKIIAKEQIVRENAKFVGAARKQLPLAPALLLREANRRRASLSAGNVGELLENRPSFKESTVTEVASPFSTPASPIVRSASGNGRPASPMASGGQSPSPSRSGIDKPMKLPEIQAAAEGALLKIITDERLKKALSSVEGFEELYLELTRAAADNYHRSWRKRHGVVLDGEVAAVYFRHGNYDSAAKLYEKVCALYAGERWHALLAEVLPQLVECQKQLGDLSGYLTSCIKLLSLDKGLLLKEERQTLLSEVVKLAHSGMKVPVSLDVSALISFSGKGGPPVDLCEGDPGSLVVTVWSRFPADITLESLSLTLIATFSADEGVKVIKSAEPPLLRPGQNNIMMMLPPQRPGSYVLGAFTGQIGQVKLRSHTYCTTSAVSWKEKAGLSRLRTNSHELHLETGRWNTPKTPWEECTCSLYKSKEVSKPRALVDIRTAAAWGLLIGEPQWLGLVIRPIDYSLKDAVLHISAGPGLSVYDPQISQLELYNVAIKTQIHSENHAFLEDATAIPASKSNQENTESNSNNSTASGFSSEDMDFLELKAGKVGLPEWASGAITVLWLRVLASREKEFSVSTGVQSLPSPPPSPKSVSINGAPSYSHTSAAKMTTKDLSKAGSLLISQGDGQDQVTAASSSSGGEGVRKLNVKLDFGVTHSRTYERSVTVQFSEPFRTITRVVTKSNDGTLILQVTLVSQLNAAITITDANLDLQDGFVEVKTSEGRADPLFLMPIAMSASAESALLFVIRLQNSINIEDQLVSEDHEKLESAVSVHYKIAGNRTCGAHPPIKNSVGEAKAADKDSNSLIFRSSFVLQMPVLDRLLAVGMLPLLSQFPGVGQQVVLQWRVERLKEGWALCLQEGVGDLSSAALKQPPQGEDEELQYEVKANPENWMIAGRTKGHIHLPQHVGARVVLLMACVPLVAGHVHPPSLHLAQISRAHISHNPPGPHLVCVLPPSTCSAFCITKQI